ncbi:hypothetical protein F5X68DRAFT_218533 [Plectosphaerella plurivora]|uniref:Uncharacterized protein n=1 Tax=Plectosphaerella plurivora TaxID=936078 RepID=A0A9P8V1B9_9PEZI|nr:hypothetical protein F5X68DRAFT_218533 [Plectosphaerella plurivora]
MISFVTHFTSKIPRIYCTVFVLCNLLTVSFLGCMSYCCASVGLHLGYGCFGRLANYRYPPRFQLSGGWFQSGGILGYLSRLLITSQSPFPLIVDREIGTTAGCWMGN